jgi:voltage-gated potassium channel
VDSGKEEKLVTSHSPLTTIKRTSLLYDPFRWIRWGLLVLLAITALSTLVYWLLGRYYGREDWTAFNCLFMVVITLTTIGYGDWLQIKGLYLAELYTMFLALVGMGVPAFVISNAIGLIVEGLFSDVFRRRRMDKQVAGMTEHLIVCGVGTTGYHCLEELVKTRHPLVAIDRDAARLAAVAQELGDFPYLVGDADDDQTLRDAGVERAAGLIACLTDDKENLFVTLSARALNPRLRIVSKVVAEAARSKLLAAGASVVVNTTAIGGLRLVSELVRPSVVTFLDAMIRNPTDNYRFEELNVAAGCEVQGQTLALAQLREHTQVLVVAAREPKRARFTYNPAPDFLLTPGTVVVLLGRMQDLEALRPRFTAPAPGP